MNNFRLLVITVHISLYISGDEWEGSSVKIKPDAAVSQVFCTLILARLSKLSTSCKLAIPINTAFPKGFIY